MNDNFSLEWLYECVNDQYQTVLSKLEATKPTIAKMFKGCKYSIFYSNPYNTLKKGDIYFLGLNPGGTPDCITIFPFETPAAFKQRKPNWCEYIDEQWKHRNKKLCCPGEALMQRRVRSLLGSVLKEIDGETKEICDVFSTNLYFFRSPDTHWLLEYGKDLCDCLKYHKEFLKIVQPKIIICNGNGETFSPFTELRDHFKTNVSSLALPDCKIKLKAFLINKPSWAREKSSFWVSHILVDLIRAIF